MKWFNHQYNLDYLHAACEFPKDKPSELPLRWRVVEFGYHVDKALHVYMRPGQSQIAE